LDYLAPCGVDCSRCADYADGEIRELSARLQQCLGNYGRLARLKAATKPEFAGWSQFEVLLDHFARASCGGCRAKDNQCPFTCKVATCHKENKVDYCFQCKRFPCDGGDPRTVTPLGERWKQNNERMRDLGVTAFYMEQANFPRY
jgi:hypothetical protein